MVSSSKSTVILSALCATLGLACEDSTKAESGDGEQAADPVASRWKESGLEIGTVKKIDESKLGTACTRYDVEGVTAMLCDYPDASAAEAAKKKGLAWIGDKTGASLVSGSRLLVVADRDGVDPSGKAINDITRVFLRPEAPPPSAAKPVESAKAGESETDSESESGGESESGSEGEDGQGSVGLGSLIPEVEGGE